MNSKIFIITHKEYEFPKNRLYSPLLVGANYNKINDFEKKYFYDNQNDNISDKNKSFCELTGLYWIWKNVISYDILGLTHYRRYFFKKKFTKNFKWLLDKNDIDIYLKNNDIILPTKKYCIDGNNYNDYKEHHNIEDLEMCKKIISESCPEYMNAFDEVMNRDYIYPFNMFVMKKKLVDEYCLWIFSVLNQIEKKINTENYDLYNKRVYGFLTERLFNVWIYKNKLKIKEIYVNNIEENIFKDYLINFIKYISIKCIFRKEIINFVKKYRKKRNGMKK